MEDFTAALRLQPETKDSTVWLSRGLAYALEQYDQAVRDFSNAIEQTPEDTMVWLRLAPILVLADDATGYAAFCGRMVQQFAGSNNPEIAERVIKACLLRADAINTERLPVETLARAMDERTAPESMWPWPSTNSAGQSKSNSLWLKRRKSLPRIPTTKPTLTC